jgi:hypothetical protein
MAYADVLVHTARPVREEETGPKVDGRPSTEPVEGTPFDCCLFLPAPSAEAERQGRRVKRPQLLMATHDRAAQPVAVSAEFRLLVTAPEVTGAEPVLWQVEGDPQPFGKPGEPLIGQLAILRRVED